MPRRAFQAENATSIGPYSHAVDSDGLVYLSGQTPIDPATGKIVGEGIKEQTIQSFSNLFNVLKSSGLNGDDVIKVNVYLTDMKHFKEMNEVYEKQFNSPYPARTTIGVKELPLNALVEIEMIARRSRN